MVVRLVHFDGRQKLAVELKEGAYVVGRDEAADIVIRNPTISTRHAEIRVDRRGCSIRDLGSTNGTWVNKIRIADERSVEPSDEVMVGSARLAFEFLAPDSVPVQAATAKMHQPMEAAGTEAPPASPPSHNWVSRLWIAAAIAVLTIAGLMLTVEALTQQASRSLLLRARYLAFAAQYIHLLEKAPHDLVPAPAVDQSLAEPIMVLDRDGVLLYPPPSADGKKSPVRQLQPGKISERHKVMLFEVDVERPGGGTVKAKSFPIRSRTSETLGYVIARPGPTSSSLPVLVLAMIVCSAVIALLAFYLALRPVAVAMRGEVTSLQSKVSAYAAGFIESLPRSTVFPELGELAGEIESTFAAFAQDELRPVTKAGLKPDDRRVNEMLDAAAIPWCLVSADYHLLAGNPAANALRELAVVPKGESIFDHGMTTMQARQIIKAINEARTAEHGRSEASLSPEGKTRIFDVVAKRFRDPSSRRDTFGILFLPRES